MNANGLNRSMGNILLLIVGGLLLGYTAYRSIHILSATLPQDAQVLAYVGLAGLDGGLLAWTLYVATGGARGDVQRAVSLLMIVVQLAGVALTSIGDAVITADPAGAPSYILVAVLWGVPAIIAANIVAITVVHLSDPRQAIARAERMLEDEIDKRVADQLLAKAGQTAAGVVPEAARAREEEILSRYTARRRGIQLRQIEPADHESDDPLEAGDAAGRVRRASNGHRKAVAGAGGAGAGNPS